jgi:replication factor C subunit 3/5
MKADWEVFITEIAMAMISEQSPQKLFYVRGKLYEILSHCIPADTILRNLTDALLARVDDTMKREIVLHASEYDHRLRMGTKAIFHLEAFVAKFMNIYKRYLLGMSVNV